MGEEETIFSSKIKYDGLFPFKDFYKFCYDWLLEETGIDAVVEEKYSEKLKGEAKDIDVEWSGTKDISDYFRFKIKVKYVIRNMSQVKVKKDGADVDTNKGNVEMGVKGILVKDYKSKFDLTAFKKFLRATYEKYVIPSTVSEIKGKIFNSSDEFIGQAKAYLDLEGRKG